MTISTDHPAHERPALPRNEDLTWLDEAACAQLDELVAQRAAADGDNTGKGAISLFFVDAGHVIAEDTLAMCHACPVRRECVIHAYTAGPGGTSIGGGYLGGFSLGQRKNMTLQAALAQVEADQLGPEQV